MTTENSRRARFPSAGRKTIVKTTRQVYVAVIGDVVRSRRLTSAERRNVQRSLERTLQSMNRRYRKALAAKFLITIGDEFQGLLLDPSVLPEFIRNVEIELPDIDLRLGIGRGEVFTDLKEYAIGTDGPAWHAARAAIEDAKRNRRLGGVFVGFGQRADLALNGFARVLHYVRSRLTAKQRELLQALLETGTQAEIAARAGITKQAVSKQARASGSDAYREAERAWRTMLTHPPNESQAHEL